MLEAFRYLDPNIKAELYKLPELVLLRIAHHVRKRGNILSALIAVVNDMTTIDLNTRASKRKEEEKERVTEERYKQLVEIARDTTQENTVENKTRTNR